MTVRKDIKDFVVSFSLLFIFFLLAPITGLVFYLLLRQNLGLEHDFITCLMFILMGYLINSFVVWPLTHFME